MMTLLQRINWNRSNLFPSSNYLTIVLKKLECVNITHKVYKLPSGGVNIKLSFLLDDHAHARSFRSEHKFQSSRTDVIYAYLLNSLCFKKFFRSVFAITMPLPSYWSLDDLRIASNDWFVDDSQSTSLNYQSQLDYLTSEINEIKLRLTRNNLD